jgi:single-stranded DNA-binding protein
MTHSVTCKLNKDARQHQGQNGVTFFVSLGEQNYNRETKQKEWTNYDCALFAKDAQIGFYTNVLVEGAVIKVTGEGIIIKIDPTGQYKPKLELTDAKLGFVHSPQPQQAHQAPQQQAPQQQAPQMANQMNSQQAAYRQPAPQQQPPQNQAHQEFSDDIPF